MVCGEQLLSLRVPGSQPMTPGLCRLLAGSGAAPGVGDPGSSEGWGWSPAELSLQPGGRYSLTPGRLTSVQHSNMRLFRNGAVG